MIFLFQVIIIMEMIDFFMPMVSYGFRDVISWEELLGKDPSYNTSISVAPYIC